MIRNPVRVNELEVFRKAARELLALSDRQITQLLESEALTEVKDDNEA
jgi:hypothetical protein